MLFHFGIFACHIKLPKVEMLINFHRLYRINVNKLPLLFVAVELLINFYLLHIAVDLKKLPLLISQWIF